MVKLTGPMHSADAAGSLADVLTFTKKGNQSYAKRYAKPKQPRTDSQLAVRAVMNFLATQWRNLTTADQATWKAAADRDKVAPYHAFVAANHHRWTTQRASSKQDPATDTPPAPNTPTFNVFPWKGYVGLHVHAWVGAPAWGALIYRAQVGFFPPTRTNLRFVELHDTPASLIFYDREVTTGDYWYRAQHFTDTGLQGPPTVARKITIT